MCFTVNVNLVKEELEKRYGRDFIDHEKYRPSYYYHAFSLPYLPVITSSHIETMQWGLIPSWVRDAASAEEIRKKTFNARSETIDVKPSFAESFRSGRCIVPVSGFYEWQMSGMVRLPWYITSTAGTIMSLGGLWSEWYDRNAGIACRTFSIVTTEANLMMAGIHNTKKRMPLVLLDDGIDSWLKDDTPADYLKKMMVPLPEGLLSAHTIGPLISKRDIDKNRPEIIEPYKYDVPGTLFD
ncbi:MAG: SOS response-associated peptidase [Bacteroidales bacterium]|jgi:putative SOS response-associated peptidase YedK|nr:SOS response-associated peptidase [Bacteroidales bacterium]